MSPAESPADPRAGLQGLSYVEQIAALRPDAVNYESQRAALRPGEHMPPADRRSLNRPAPIPIAVEGLSSPMSITRFAIAAHAVENTWDLMQPEERAEEMERAVGDECRAHDIPAPDSELASIPNAGEMHSAEWIMKLSEIRFRAPLGPDGAADVAETVYHEARHAEQYHRAARMLAGRGHAAPVIASSMNLHLNVAEHAAERALDDGGREQGEAEGWHESIYGEGRADREVIARERLEAEAAVSAAIDEDVQVTFSRDASPEEREAARARLAAARLELDRWMEAYYALPEEADAHTVGARFAEVYERIEALDSGQ